MDFLKLSPLIFIFCLPLALADIAYPGMGPSYGLAWMIALIIFNFVINFGIVKLILRVFKQPKSFPGWLRLVIVTVLGFICDAAALGVASVFFYGYGLLTVLSVGVMVFILVGLISYFVLFNNLERKKRLYCAALFGLISNPFWILIIFLIMPGQVVG